MAEATSTNCVNAFIRGWIKEKGLPSEAISDNGNTFIAKMWQGIHEKLNTIVSYTPLYSPSSLGLAERQHRELKTGLKACLLTMANEATESISKMEALQKVIERFLKTEEEFMKAEMRLKLKN